MRNILYFILLISMSFASCESILDLEPQNAVTFEHFFENEYDLEAITAQLHSDLRNELSKVTYQEHIGAKIDRINGSAMVYEKLRNYDENLITSKQSQQQWQGYYNVLHIVDLFMDNYHKVRDISDERLNFYKGQHYFVRALCYFYLTRIWGDVVITKGSYYVDPYAKSSASIVIDSAISYALKAYKLLPRYEDMRNASGKVLTSKQYGCKGSVAGLLTHLYTWKGSLFNQPQALQEAINWADVLIDPEYHDEVGRYKLAENPDLVCSNELKRKGEESIFELEMSYTDNSNYTSFSLGAFLIGWPIINNREPGDIVDCQYGIYRQTVNDLYEKQDQRRTAYFYQIDAEHLNNANLVYLHKWRYALHRANSIGGSDYINLDANKIIIRLADIYLLRAECYAKIGKSQEAINDLNTIRYRANATLYPNAINDENSQKGLQYAIFLEREKELLLEGHRYYDIMRNKGYYKTQLSDGFSRLTESDVERGALYLPIPATAFKYNPLMIQNNYWISKMK